MKKYSIALATSMVLSVIVGGELGFAQSSNQKELAQRHFEAAKKAAAGEVAELYDHLCSRLLVGARVGNDVIRSYLTVAAECSAAAELRPDLYKGYLGR